MKTFLKIILTIILSAIALTALLQATTIIYNTPADDKPFTGDSIFNPYRGIRPEFWRKANNHSHQRLMYGALDFPYTEAELRKAYIDRGYDLLNLTDHQYINPTFADSIGYIPAYEHGMGLNNFHLGMLGANSVSWFEYPIMTNPRHQMQSMIDLLKPQCKLLVLNHPERLRFASYDVYKTLRGYDLWEMNPEPKGFIWDAALSNGIFSLLIANDDTHTATDHRRWLQKSYSMINSPTTSGEDILESLAQGRTYGTLLDDQSHDSLPRIEDIGMRGDTIFIELTTAADSILFIGQNGVIKSQVNAVDSASYVFMPQDSYIRIEAHFDRNKVQIWTNPFARSADGAKPIQLPIPGTNYQLTILNSIIWGIVFVVILLLITRLYRKSKKRKFKYNPKFT